MATRKKRYKCRLLDTIQASIQLGHLHLIISDMQVNKECVHNKCNIENCISLNIHHAVQFLTNISKTEFRCSLNKVCSSPLRECFLKSVMGIKNSQQNFTYPVLLFSEQGCQTFSCQKLKVNSQTQTTQYKYKDIKEEHRRKRSPERPTSRENLPHEVSSSSRRNRHNSSGITTHETNHVVTTQRPEFLNESLFDLLKSMFPELYLPDSTFHLPIHHRTSTERQHSSTEHTKGEIVSTTNDLTWTNSDVTSTSSGDPRLNWISTSASVGIDVTKDETAYSSETPRTITIDSVTDEIIFTDLTSMTDTTNDNTRAHTAASTTIKSNISTINTGGVNVGTTEHNSTSDVLATHTTAVHTGMAKGHHTTVGETTVSTMGLVTTDVIPLNTATINDNTSVVTTNDVPTPPIIKATDALPETVTTNAVTTPNVIATYITTLANVTEMYSTMQTSSKVGQSDATTGFSVIDIKRTSSVAIDATTDTNITNYATTATNTTNDATTVSAIDVTSAASVAIDATTLGTNITIDITTKFIASSTKSTTQESIARTTLAFTEPETRTVAVVPETNDFTTTVFTTVNASIYATADDMNMLATTTGDSKPSTVQIPDVVPTESVSDGSEMVAVTPDSRPYGFIEDTTSLYTLMTNTGAVTTTKLAMGTENSANNITIQVITTDTTESNNTTADQMPTITTVENTATMVNGVTTQNITNLSQDTYTSTQTTINQTVDTETVSRTITRQMPTLHVLGIGTVTRPVSTKDTTTSILTTSNATSATPDSAVYDITSAIMDGSLQCSRSSGVMCFLDAVNRSLHSETTNITHDQLMDSCELVMDKLQNVVTFRSDHNATKVLTNYFQVLDTFLSIHLNTPSLRQNQRLDNILTKVTSFVDNMMQPMKTAYTFHQDIRLTLTNLDLLMLQLQPEALKERQLNMRSVAITVHDIRNFTNIQTPDNATVTALVLTVLDAEVSLVNSKSATQALVSSRVLSLSAAVGGSKVSLIHTFSMTVSHPKNLTFSPVCGFQSQNESGETIWDTQGCHVSSYTDGTSPLGMFDNSESRLNLTGQDASKPSVVCKCNHTTNFAILMQVVDFEVGEVDEMALSIITYIGCSVTLITQVIAITVFTCIRSLNSERVCVHRNLCISIMAAQITFISGIKAVSNRIVCAVVAVLLHYFYTSSFMWMLVEGLHLYNMIVKVFGTERSRIVYYTCLGYGLPLLLVAISAVVDWDGYGTNTSCWLSIQRSTIWAFVGPAMAIIIVNFVILAVVIRIVVTSARMDKNSDYDHIRAGIKATLLLLPLLGLTWVFGLAAVNEKVIIFQYLFAILNTLQGFFIFMLHCVFNKEVRQTLNRIREKRSLQKGEFGNTISPSGHGRPSSSDSRSSSSTYVIIKEAVSSAFSRRTIQVSPADLCFAQREKQREIGNKHLPHKEKEHVGIGNYYTKSRNLY